MSLDNLPLPSPPTDPGNPGWLAAYHPSAWLSREDILKLFGCSGRRLDAWLERGWFPVPEGVADAGAACRRTRVRWRVRTVRTYLQNIRELKP